MSAPFDVTSFLRQWGGVPESEAARLLKLCTTRKYAAGECFIHAGEVPQRAAINLSGLFRYYYCDAQGTEFTKGFFPERTFIASYSAMISRHESRFTIQALEDSSLLVFQYNDWQSLLEGHSCWSKVLIALLEKAFIAKENRERELLLWTAEEKYVAFLAQFPGLDKRIRQHYIASYLGITPVALSRVRKKMGLVNIG